jgi:antitoxin component YwqK of YwqJK toxin-antitoxin module
MLHCFFSASQVDSIEINGEHFKVYPFKEKINIPPSYWTAIKDKEYFEDYENYFQVFGEGRSFTRELFETAETEDEKEFLQKRLKRMWEYERAKKRRGTGARFIKRVRQDPSCLLTPKYEFNKEVIPPFGAIPDGKYVQLFSEFCLVDEKGMCQEKVNLVAGYFNIKNNALDGYAVWVDLKGDTIKEGHFKNGLKEGEWKFTKSDLPPRYMRAWKTKGLRQTGRFTILDTVSIVAEYKKGVLHGEFSYYSTDDQLKIDGHYIEGNEAGNWKTYWDEKLIQNVTYADPSNDIVSKKPIIRTEVFIEGNYFVHNLAYKYGRMEIPSDFYTINFSHEDDLELEEEDFQSHELEYYGRYEEDMLPERVRGSRNLYSNRYYSDYRMFSMVKDPETKKVSTRGYFIDSIGAIMKYDGAYEMFYPNGQLYTRYQFENGELVEEDTLFWDNGIPHDIIEYNADSNYFYRHAYDYDGVLMKTAIYDSLGDFMRYDEEPEPSTDLEIDGIVAELDDLPRRTKKDFTEFMAGNYIYRNFKQLDTIIPENEKLVLYRLYSGIDTSVLSEVIFDPVTRKYTDFDYSYTGKKYWEMERTFTENFESWTGKTTWSYRDYTIVTTASGILKEFENDTMPHRHVRNSYSHYDVTEDVEIFKDGELYTGPVKLKRRALFAKQPGAKLVMRFASSKSKKNERQLYKYFKSGKGKSNNELGLVNSVSACKYVNGNILRNLFETANESYFEEAQATSHDYYYYRDNSKMKKVKGQLVEGKAQGTWQGKNGTGKLMGEIAFDKGEPIGTHTKYAFVDGEPKWKRESSEDSLPARKTYYKYSTTEFVNGMKHGPYRQYTWYGRPEESGTYKDDYLDGVYRTEYPMAYSIANYKEGMLDGYVQTYLTLPYEDTMLLYDLNFQHGLLNGESNAYHTNGKLAKRGFFLDGEPIDDYEAYDTLGFRYHYVKFKYSFPVEEKIWEENQLSLRYRFDWEDSIAFDPSDITSSMSLESLMYRLGYGTANLNAEYYGRPRLIDKTGLDYHMTKFYPNDTIAREGRIIDGKKIGNWTFFNYDGVFLYEVDYFDSIIRVNDSVAFKSKGILTEYDENKNQRYKAYIIEKMEKYDCAHTDHYEIRQLYTFWEASDSIGRMNGYVQNFYDNGTLQNEGYMKDGLPDGLWKYYDPFGKMNLMGTFHQGKRHGRWLSGDLEKKKYLGEICLNPNLPDLEKEKKYRENLLDVTIITYDLGKAVNKQFYDLNLNKFADEGR